MAVRKEERFEDEVLQEPPAYHYVTQYKDWNEPIVSLEVKDEAGSRRYDHTQEDHDKEPIAKHQEELGPDDRNNVGETPSSGSR